MKRLAVLAVCAVILLGLTGCRGGSGNGGVEAGASNKNVAVATEFPKSLAGTWKSDNQVWQIDFEPDGTISSAVTPLGLVKVRPNRKTRVPGLKGEPGFFEAGDFDVYYNQQNRELTVNIKIKQFYLYTRDNGILKGSWEYLITGNILEDEKTWAGDVFSSPDIVALVPDPNHITDESKFTEVAKLHVNLGDEEKERLIFTKVPDVNAGSNK